MRTFIEETLLTLRQNHSSLSGLTLILPSKRAGGFLKNHLKKELKQTQFAPKIISIEEFVEEIAELSMLDNTELLFKSYQVYINSTGFKDKDNFETYVTWATTLMNDFNEMDRYMVPTKEFFGLLADIKSLERWGVEKEQSTFITNYLEFWKSLPELYHNLQELLKAEQTGYQGMVYREAANNIDSYILNHSKDKHIFIGFNALNTAEQHIIQRFLETGSSEIYWDIDTFFMEDELHSASMFIRKYLKDWNYYQQKEKPIFGAHFESEKTINIVEVQKNIGQAKYVGELLSASSEDTLNNTAVVLGDEDILVPLLYSLPENVTHLNVTMGMPLKNYPAATFVERILYLQLKPEETLYYKDILSILDHPLASQLILDAQTIKQRLNTDNISHIKPEDLLNLASESSRAILAQIFTSWEDNGAEALENIQEILRKFLETTTADKIGKLTITKLIELFTKIQGLSDKYPYINSVRSFFNLYNELVDQASLDFEGDAFEGLQLMGVLETRVLDFENIIITSVNEGTFPSGKSNASYITYDMKQHFGMPLFYEKDAIYTYHFYRLLQRAKNITLLYDGYNEGMNSGEKSRFISQLEIEPNENHHYEKQILSSHIELKPSLPKQIEKTEGVLERLEEIAAKGFSPSALTSYIRNPIDFYFDKILKVREYDEVEEDVAANTLGTIVHNTLENFYKPLEGKMLTIPHLQEMKKKIEEEVTHQFKEVFRGGTFSRGKNRIVFEVAQRYVSNFIDSEIEAIEDGNTIEILQIEEKLSVELPILGIDFPVRIGGIMDRVDRYNGKLRIIDYKTGYTEDRNLTIIDWDTISEDYDKSKAFQVLTYALMISGEFDLENADAGIISFRNLSEGFLRFGTKPTPNSRSKTYGITTEILTTFTEELKKLILEICSPEIPFIEKEIK